MPSNQKQQFIDDDLQDRKSANLYRSLQTLIPAGHGLTVTKSGRELINFCSNDYLGLSKHPEVVRKSQAYTQKFGAGSTSSRLISGTFSIHEQLEGNLAATLNREAALIFNSGFQANSTLVETVTDRHSLVLADKLSHNSLLQGSLASRAKLKRYDHNDLAHLKKLLDKAAGENYSRILIITETVFSMDGDRSQVKKIAGLADAYNALLFVDDAHAVGVWGDDGLGLGYDVEGIDILLGTCGKAFGSFGAYVACSAQMKEYLINYCPGFIYTTALPPAVVGAIDAALALIPRMEDERARYHQTIEKVRSGLQASGFNTGPSSTQIIPVIIGDEAETLNLAEWLEEQGILASAIRPPTVPENSSRIRLTISLAHTDAQIDFLLNKMKEWSDAGS